MHSSDRANKDNILGGNYAFKNIGICIEYNEKPRRAEVIPLGGRHYGREILNGSDQTSSPSISS